MSDHAAINDDPPKGFWDFCRKCPWLIFGICLVAYWCVTDVTDTIYGAAGTHAGKCLINIETSK